MSSVWTGAPFISSSSSEVWKKWIAGFRQNYQYLQENMAEALTDYHFSNIPQYHQSPKVRDISDVIAAGPERDFWQDILISAIIIQPKGWGGNLCTVMSSFYCCQMNC